MAAAATASHYESKSNIADNKDVHTPVRIKVSNNNLFVFLISAITFIGVPLFFQLVYHIPSLQLFPQYVFAIHTLVLGYAWSYTHVALIAVGMVCAWCRVSGRSHCYFNIPLIIAIVEGAFQYAYILEYTSNRSSHLIWALLIALVIGNLIYMLFDPLSKEERNISADDVVLGVVGSALTFAICIYSFKAACISPTG